MKNISDTLTITFDSDLDGETGICVSRTVNGKVVVLKMELGEQADILYRLLTEQTTKVEIKLESEDCISRKAVKKLICQNNDKYGYSDRFHEFTKRLLQLPSVNPQQKVGKWEEAQFGGFICSECGNYTKGEWSDKLNEMIPFKYCPECGAKMEDKE